jgi:hypothetical protein
MTVHYLTSQFNGTDKPDTAWGGLFSPMSQCDFMGQDPMGYLIEALY